MQMKKATAISAGLHAAVLVWATVSFSSRALDATPVESLPVDFISEKDFSQLTKGIKEAPKPVDKPKPLVEKKAEPIKPVEDIKPKISDKPEIKPTADKVPTPPPAPEQKPEKQKEAKAADPKPPEPMAEQKPDPIAEKLKKDDTPKLSKVAERLPPRRPTPQPQKPQPKFDADKIAALLDQRDPRRMAAAGVEPNSAPTLGTAMGNAPQLSQSEFDALRARLMALWNPPVGIQNPEDYIIRIRIRLGRDGRLSAPPAVLSSGNGALFNTARDSAVRAVFQGQPFDMLRPEHYEAWKDIEVTFDPRDMFRG